MKFKSKEDDIAMAAAASAAQDKAAYDLKMSVPCKVCQHTAAEHVTYNPYQNVMSGYQIIGGGKHEGCLAKIWTVHQHNFISYKKSETCDCPLKPNEVLHNAEQ